MFTVGILTISDKGAAGDRQDRSGAVIREILPTIDARIVNYEIIPDEKGLIVAERKGFSRRGQAQRT